MKSDSFVMSVCLPACLPPCLPSFLPACMEQVSSYWTDINEIKHFLKIYKANSGLIKI
jgi:hypothetical protein